MVNASIERPPLQFSIRGLLVVCAGVGAGVGLCITLADLEDATDTHRGLSSEVRFVDGVPETVLVTVRISTDTGLVVSDSHLRRVYLALAIEIATLVGSIAWLVRWSHRNRKTEAETTKRR